MSSLKKVLIDNINEMKNGVIDDKVERIIVEGDYWLDNNIVFKIPKNLKSLVFLGYVPIKEITECPEEIESNIIVKFPQNSCIKRLEVDNYTHTQNIKDLTCQDIKINDLYLENFYLSTQNIRDILRIGCLEKLSLAYCRLTSDQAEILINSPNITSLDIRSNGDIETINVTHSTLKSLSISGESITEGFKTNKTITQLTISEKNVCEDIFTSVCENLTLIDCRISVPLPPSVEHLSLISDVFFSENINLENIQSLNLDNTRLSAKSVRSLSANLMVLNIGGCIDPKNIAYIFSKCKHLIEINVAWGRLRNTTTLYKHIPISVITASLPKSFGIEKKRRHITTLNESPVDINIKIKNAIKSIVRKIFLM
jgi:hypothetical protein